MILLQTKLQQASFHVIYWTKGYLKGELLFYDILNAGTFLDTLLRKSQDFAFSAPVHTKKIKMCNPPEPRVISLGNSMSQRTSATKHVM